MADVSNVGVAAPRQFVVGNKYICINNPNGKSPEKKLPGSGWVKGRVFTLKNYSNCLWPVESEPNTHGIYPDFVEDYNQYNLKTPKLATPVAKKKVTKDNAGLSETMGAMLAQVVMPKDHKKAILETLCQANKENHDKIFTEWGFDEVVEKGKGLVFMFYGVPGTGKTMSAQAIAEHLGRKYLLIGTAELQSSVPGQMERNIKDAFKKAKTDKLVIIFDECDSLLYNRNHVGAILGAEINTLLSEIERFEGVCILTTNRNLMLDPALERRVALKLEFKKPDAEMRFHIWGKLIPAKCPIHKDVNIKRIAEEFELCGGNIKNIVLSAARSAVYAKKEAIELEDFVKAIEKELKGQEAFEQKYDRVGPAEGVTSDITEGFKGLVKSNGLFRRRVKVSANGNGKYTPAVA